MSADWLDDRSRVEKEIVGAIRAVYACGYHDGGDSYGMFAGPSPALDDMLAAVPEDGGRPAVLFRFNPDGTNDVLYRWSGDTMSWEKKAD